MVFDIILIIVAIAVIIFCILFLCVYFKARKERKRFGDPRPKGQSEPDPLTELTLGVMGSELLHHQGETRKREREKKEHDSLFWQEAIRNKK
ncbi:MAG: hypothetical protein Q4E27_04655 [Bacteroidales bacterium]|nr:hypothetical protein [Bacteroidales bacterium]